MAEFLVTPLGQGILMGGVLGYTIFWLWVMGVAYRRLWKWSIRER